MSSASTKSLSEFRLKTHARVDIVDITLQVEQAVQQGNVASGIAVVYCPHTTAAITVNENADPDVLRDIRMALGTIAPETGDYRHAEGNSDAHIKSSLFGPSQVLIIEGGRLLLGMWQGVYFCEFDGPRERKFYVKIVSENVGE